MIQNNDNGVSVFVVEKRNRNRQCKKKRWWYFFLLLLSETLIRKNYKWNQWWNNMFNVTTANETETVDLFIENKNILMYKHELITNCYCGNIIITLHFKYFWINNRY